MTLSASPAPLAFGDVGVDTDSTLRVKVTSDQSISATPNATSSDSAFTATVLPVDESGMLFAVDVTCHPTQEQAYSGRLTIRVQNRRVHVSLSATGVMSSVDTQGSHLLIKIPDYADTDFVNVTVAHDEGIDPTGVSGKQLQSYLRLGTFDYDAESPAAKQLLQLIPKVNAAHDPTRPEGTSIIHQKGTEKIEGTIFVDDVRIRAGDTPGSSLSTSHDPDHKLDQAKRQAESAKLYSRGGWRDHSDGNRVSTTWGDKVEVVRGNYKMVVMGRQNDPGQAMGWDATGAHIQDFAPGTMPGASFWLEWIDDSRYYGPEFHDPAAGSKLGATGAVKPTVVGQKGVWLLVNTTENVYEYARNAGNFREEKWGDVHEAYCGSENPPTKDGQEVAFAETDTAGTEGHGPPDGSQITGLNYDLPHRPATGDGTPDGTDSRSSPPWYADNKGMVRSNPHIIEKTWARRIDGWTGSSACRVPEIHEQTWADKIDELTNCSGTITSDTVAGAINERAAVGAKATTEVYGPVAETTSMASLLSTTVIEGVEIENKYVTGSWSLLISLGTSIGIEVLKEKVEFSLVGQKFELAAYLGGVTVDACGGLAEYVIGAREEFNIPKKKEIDLEKTEEALKKQANAIQTLLNAANLDMKSIRSNWVSTKIDIGSMG